MELRNPVKRKKKYTKKSMEIKQGDNKSNKNCNYKPSKMEEKKRTKNRVK